MINYTLRKKSVINDSAVRKQLKALGGKFTGCNLIENLEVKGCTILTPSDIDVNSERYCNVSVYIDEDVRYKIANIAHLKNAGDDLLQSLSVRFDFS